MPPKLPTLLAARLSNSNRQERPAWAVAPSASSGGDFSSGGLSPR
jgi:hypothetical protein